MPYNLVHDVSFWRILWIFIIADVESRTKIFECKRVKELPPAENSISRFNSKTTLAVQIIRYFPQLRYPL